MGPRPESDGQAPHRAPEKIPVLRRGDFSNLYSQGKVCIFARRLESETVIVGLNAVQVVRGSRPESGVHSG